MSLSSSYLGLQTSPSRNISFSKSYSRNINQQNHRPLNKATQSFFKHWNRTHYFRNKTKTDLSIRPKPLTPSGSPRTLPKKHQELTQFYHNLRLRQKLPHQRQAGCKNCLRVGLECQPCDGFLSSHSRVWSRHRVQKLNILITPGRAHLSVKKSYCTRSQRIPISFYYNEEHLFPGTSFFQGSFSGFKGTYWQIRMLSGEQETRTLASKWY